MSGTTAVIGAPGVGSKTGAAYVLILQNGYYVNQQQLQASDLTSGDEFGGSVSVDESTSTVVCGARLHSAETGAVYVYTLVGSTYYQQQKITSVVSRGGAQFGTGVDISGNTIIVGVHEEYSGELRTQNAVQSITTTADTTLGNYFRIGYRQVSDGNTWADRLSRYINHDATASDVQEALEADLDTGELIVTRSNADATGGYKWMLTFVESENNIPQMAAEYSSLKGSNAKVDIDVVVPLAPVLNRHVYIFTRSGSTWTEQVTLSPRNKKFFRYVSR